MILILKFQGAGRHRMALTESTPYLKLVKDAWAATERPHLHMVDSVTCDSSSHGEVRLHVTIFSLYFGLWS